jgi:hypothetical protein
VCKTIGISVQDFGDTCNLRSGLSGGGGVFASHQHMHLTTTRQGGGDGVQGGGFDAVIVVFSNNK